MPEQITEESGKPSSSQPDQSTENSKENTAFESNEPPPPSYDQAKTMPTKPNQVCPAPMTEPIPIQPVSTQPVTVQPISTTVTTNPVVVMTPTTVNPYILGSHSTMITCPYCHQTVSPVENQTTVVATHLKIIDNTCLIQLINVNNLGSNTG